MVMRIVTSVVADAWQLIHIKKQMLNLPLYALDESLMCD